MSQYGLLGERLGHSFSPAIHKQLWDCDYDLVPLPPDQVDEFFRRRDFSGFNVTIPYKQIACETCEHVDPRAKAIGAVNTVVNRDGVLYGYNTDYAGFLYCARRAGISFAGKKVLILGSGGTSLTARYAAADTGAREIVVVSRSTNRLPAQADPTVSHRSANVLASSSVENSSATVGITRCCPLSFSTYDHLAEAHCDADVIINTTPVGMYPNNYAAPVDLTLFPNLSGVVDVIYNPGTTLLVHTAKSLNIPATCGLPMLVAQAAYAAEYFSGRAFSDEDIERVYKTVLAMTSNIILIGMPGCGKTTVGKLLSRRLNRDVVDVDALIVERERRSIPDIFSSDGEEAFRRCETEAAKLVGAKTGIIISCGGGLPMWERNHYPMLQNGRIYYLNRNTSRLSVDGRPLSQQNRLSEMYAKRHPVYQALCHRELPVTEGDPGAIIEQLVEDFYENIGD